jgi:hypothetical protein
VSLPHTIGFVRANPDSPERVVLKVRQKVKSAKRTQPAPDQTVTQPTYPAEVLSFLRHPIPHWCALSPKLRDTTQPTNTAGLLMDP